MTRRRTSWALLLLLLAGGALKLSAVAEEQSGSMIMGFVVDHEEKPVAGMVVRALRVAQRKPHEYPSRNGIAHLFERQTAFTWVEGESHDTTTDEKGRFRMTGLMPGELYTLEAGGRSDVASYFRHVRAGTQEGDSLRLVIEPSRTVRLRVLDEKDAPVAGAQLQYGLAPYARPWSGSGTRWGFAVGWTQTTDAEGRAAIAVPEQNSLYVGVVVPGRVWLTGSPVDPSSADEQVIRIGVKNGAIARGIVRDSERRPIVGARVSVNVKLSEMSMFGQRRFHALATTNREGRFHVLHLPSGPIDQIQVDADGFLLRSHYDLPLEGDPGEPLEIELGLRRTSVVRGRIVDDHGDPVAGAVVTVGAGWQGGRSWYTHGQVGATTDADGRYHVAGLDIGQAKLTVQAPGCLSPATQGTPIEITIDSEGTEVVQDVTVTRLAPIEGRVVGTDGEPRVGVEVFAWIAPSNPRPLEVDYWSFRPRVRSGPDGRFAFAGVPVGLELGVSVSDSDGSGETMVRVDADDPPKDVEVVWTRPARIRGRVVDSEGRPVAGAGVHSSASSAASTTDATGRFEVTHGIRPGVVKLALGPYVQGPDAIEVDVAPGEIVEGVELVLSGTGVIEGVVAASAGTPRADTPVVAKLVGANEMGVGATTDARGRFRLTHLPEGRYQIQVDGRNWGPPIRPDGDSLDIRYLPVPPPYVMGRVRLPGGRPLPRGTVSVRTGETRRYPTRRAPVFAGAFRVRLMDGDGPTVVAVADAREVDGTVINVLPGVREYTGDDSPLVIDLRRGDIVTGRLVDEDGRGLEGHEVQIYKPGDHFWWWLPRHAVRRTAEDGSFTYVGLPAAQYKLQILPRQGYAPVPVRDISTGPSPDVIEVPTARRLTFRVTSEDGIPLEGARVTVHKKEPRWLQNAPHVSIRPALDTGADGRYVSDGWPPNATFDVAIGWLRREDGWYFGRQLDDVAVGDLGDVTLERGVRITGTVTTEDGQPAPGVMVRAESWYVDDELPKSSVRMGAQHEFELGPLRAGRYRLVVTGPPEFTVPDSILVDAPASDVAIRVGRALAVRGRVIDPSGDAQKAVFLYRDPETGKAVSKEARVQNRQFAIQVPVDVEGSIFIWGRPNKSALLSPVRSSSTEPVVLEMQPFGVVTGIVDDWPESARKRQGKLKLVQGAFVRETSVQKDGTFHFRAVPVGRYRIELDPEQFRGRLDGPQSVESGDRDVRLRYVAR